VNWLGLLFVFLFVALLLGLGATSRGVKRELREIPAFARLASGIGAAVEAGRRLHLSLGHGGILGQPGASTFMGLSILQRIARTASVSDMPPIATSGESVQAILSQDVFQSVYQTIGAESQFDPNSGQLTGLSPFSFAAGAMPVVFDQQVSLNVLAGSFGSEAALIADAAERAGSMTLAGSENLTAQAVFYASTEAPLIGEELFAAGAYLQAGASHNASLMTQDIFRWLLILVILAGAAARLVGVW
jgi:hypothetical protein